MSEKQKGARKRKHTAILSTEFKEINPTNLRTTDVSPEIMEILKPPQQNIEQSAEIRYECKIAELAMTLDSRQIHACVGVGRNLLIKNGIIPIRTKDPNDEKVIDKLFDMLQTAPIVYSMAMIYHMLLLCPSFCQYMATEFDVDRGQLDSFVNDLRSEVTVHQSNYITGVLRDSHMFVTYATQQWLQNRPVKSKREKNAKK